MGALTEVEIFDCLRTNLRSAAMHARQLAREPKRGLIYEAFRTELGLIEGACRQAAYWRGGDARWLQIGLKMAEAHRLAGTWLRSFIAADSITQALQPNFVNLATQLEALYRIADGLQNKRTGRAGPILPRVGRDTSGRVKPVQVRLPTSPGGVILPSGVSL